MSGSNQVLCDLSEKFEDVCLAKDEDFFSNLPEPLISSIISLLPTNSAVRTSVLSKDWEYRWTTIYDFEIIYGSWFGQKEASFVKFVDRVLLHAQAIKCFKLVSFSKCDKGRFASWILAALRHKIEILQLFNATWTEEDEKERDNHGACFLNKSSLRELILINPPFQLSAEFCLPNLTFLEFINVWILNESSNTNHLKYIFPVLKTLALVSCTWLKVKLVEIHTPELTKFFISGDTEIPAEGEDGYSIRVISDKLEKFSSDCYLPDEPIVTGSRVVHATFSYKGPTDDFDEDQFSTKKGLQVLTLLTEFSSLMKLELTNSMIEAMGKWRYQFPFPKFPKLAQLVLWIPVYSEELLELLHAAPYLKFMHIKVDGEECWDDDNYDEVESVPSCVVSQLEEVIFTYTNVEDPQYHLAKFFLKNGRGLKKFHACNRKLTSDKILEKLCAFPKVSTSLTISAF